MVFEDTSKEKEELVTRRGGEEREDSPISDCGSITVKEERIMVDDPELEEENKTKKEKKNKKTETFTPNIADTQASAATESEPVENSEMESEQAQGTKSPSPQDSTATQNSEKNRTKEAGIQKSEEYRFFCKLCHIGFLKETSYKYHFANNIELHKKMKRTTGKVVVSIRMERFEYVLCRNESVTTVVRALLVTSSSGSTCTTSTSWTILSSARSATSF